MPDLDINFSNDKKYMSSEWREGQAKGEYSWVCYLLNGIHNTEAQHLSRCEQPYSRCSVRWQKSVVRGPTVSEGTKVLDLGLGEAIVGNIGHIRTKIEEAVVKIKVPDGGWCEDGIFYIHYCPLKEKGKEFLQSHRIQWSLPRKHVGFSRGKKFEGLSASSVDVEGPLLSLVSSTSSARPA